MTGLRSILCCLSLLFVLEGPACIARAEASTHGNPSMKLVRQPFQDALPFYVYAPSFLSSPWHLTAKGFPVLQLPSGFWVYGYVPPGKASDQCVSTGIVAGTVMPSSVGLSPLAPPLPFSHRETLPLVLWAVRSYEKSLPSWTRECSFYDLLERHDAVDRVGVSDSLGLPVAWKGNIPEVAYFWTGKEWKSLALRQGETLGMALERASHVMVSSRKGLPWTRQDSALLQERIQARGYTWIGDVE